MTIPILVDVAVGATTTETAVPELVSIPDAVRIAVAAQQSGAAALRILDTAGDRRALDPSVAASYLAGHAGGIGYLLDIATTYNAPYNTARRVLSFDRAGGGRAGVVLHAGGGDEVSDAVAPSASPTAAARWAEYAEILARLWESFPRTALLGDQDHARVADISAIAPIDHDGRGYRVAGPLDGPSSVQGRPVLAAVRPDVLGWDTAARAADVVIVEGGAVSDADRALTAATDRVGRRRADVVLVGRAEVTVADARDGRAAAVRLADWANAYRLDAVELAPTGGADGVLAAVELLAARLTAPPGPTLRAALGIPAVAAVLR
ncbi:putative monooxygenase [Nocardia nova SH22a]|uniref:Putative monooxygenase n=1 Tax=Nocardia nova SH22a TaxID=1415166 RepID=W5TF66_9NOCA|nr:LLM class flavin-dependent oxidoreductase [Nocardia nova]AHH17847.1 putative monooxygenase [Nocardia nova SH22a]